MVKGWSKVGKRQINPKDRKNREKKYATFLPISIKYQVRMIYSVYFPRFLRKNYTGVDLVKQKRTSPWKE